RARRGSSSGARTGRDRSSSDRAPFGCETRAAARAEVAEGGALPRRVRERMVERGERVGARYVNLELLVQVGVDDRDLHAAGGPAPEERDGEAVVLADRELAPGVVLKRCAHGSSVRVATACAGHGIRTSLTRTAVVRS